MNALVLALLQFRNTRACKQIDGKFSGFIPPEVPVSITNQATDLMAIVPRKPASDAGRSFVTVIQHGRASQTATVHGALELSSPPFEVRLEVIRAPRPKWHVVESPSPSSLIPIFGSEYYNPELAPKVLERVTSTKPETVLDVPVPRFYTWPGRVPVW